MCLDLLKRLPGFMCVAWILPLPSHRLTPLSRMSPPDGASVEVKDYPLVRVIKETITAKWTGHGDQVVATRFGQGSEIWRSLVTEEEPGIPIVPEKGSSTANHLIDPFFCHNGRCDSFYACSALLIPLTTFTDFYWGSESYILDKLMSRRHMRNPRQRASSLVISSDRPLFAEAISDMMLPDTP